MLGTAGLDISNLFHIPVIMPASGNYASSVIPVIFAVAFGAWFEKKYKKWIPDTIKMFTVPLITCFVTVCLTFWVIGPVASMASDLVGMVFMAIYRFSLTLKTKNKRLKSLCVPAIVSGFAGVTELAIYGITLPKKQKAIGTEKEAEARTTNVADEKNTAGQAGSVSGISWNTVR